MASPTGQRGVSPFFCRRNHRPVFSADHIIIRRTGAVNAFFRFFNLPPEDLLFSRKYSCNLLKSPLAISFFHLQMPPRRQGEAPKTPASKKICSFLSRGGNNGPRHDIYVIGTGSSRRTNGLSLAGNYAIVKAPGGPPPPWSPGFTFLCASGGHSHAKNPQPAPPLCGGL